MMQHEFEALAGYEVSTSDYNEIIEPMYMATSLSRQEFVKVIDKKRFALKTKKQIIAEMRKLANDRVENCKHYTDYETEKKLEALLDELVKRFYSGATAFIQRAYTTPFGRGCTADKVVHIGDSITSDVNGAKAVGIKPILLDRDGKHGKQDVPAVKSLLEVLEMIQHDSD